MESRRLILSERSALQEKMAAELNAGDVVDGVVSSVMDFGAFVSIGNSDKGLRGIRVRPSVQHESNRVQIF